MKRKLEKSKDPYRNIEGFDRHYRRLPHFQIEGSLYACASRTYDFRELTLDEREVVFNAIWFLDGKKYDLHGVVIMPDHFHLLIKPLKESGKTHSLGRIFHSIKSFTSHRIAGKAGGRVWQDERYDRVVRNEKEYYEQLKYLRDNPAEAGLIGPGEEYRWMWHIGMPKPVEAE